MFLCKSRNAGWLSVLVLLLAGSTDDPINSRLRLDAQEPAKSESKAATAPGAKVVQVVQPQKGEFRRVLTLPASMEAFESIKLFSKVSGFIKNQFVDIGDRVKRGDRLAAVDVPEIEAQARYDEAAVEQARARVLEAKANVSSKAADLDAAKLTVQQAEANVTSSAATVQYREKQWKRMQKLFDAKAIDPNILDESKQHYDAAMEAERGAKAAVATAKAQVAASMSKSDQAKARLAVVEAGVKMAMAKLDRSKALLSFAVITAPIDGIITQRSYFVGEFIRSASDGTNPQPMLVVQRTDLMRVVVQIPDRDASFVDRGDKAEMEIDAFPNKKWSIKVARIAGAEDPQTRLMRAEFDLPNPTGQLRPGLTGRVILDLGVLRDVLSIPSACLVGKRDNGKGTVYVVRESRARRVAVQIGSDNGQRVEVRSGLTSEDRVIFQPAPSLSDGAEVTPSARKEDAQK